MILTKPLYADGTRTVVQRSFGGIDMREGASDGALFDTLNMTSEHYPVLSSRAGVAEYPSFATVSSVLGLADTGRSGYSLLAVYDVADTPYYLVSYYDDATESETVGVAVATEGGNVLTEAVSEYSPAEEDGTRHTRPHAVAWGESLVLFFGDACYRAAYDKDSRSISVERLDEHYEGTAAVYFDEYKSITLFFPIFEDEQESREASLAAGCKVRVRCEDGYDGYLYVKRSLVDFSPERELAWVVELDYAEDFCERNIDGGYPDGVRMNISLDLSVPVLEHICVNRDRIWGVEGNRIYACASSDPRHWFRYDGNAADSFYAEIGEVSSFTGICNYTDSVYLFTREGVYRMYGSTPDAFSLVSLGLLGLEESESGSFGCASGVLLYNSVEGVVAFDGSSTSNVGISLGREKLHAVKGIGCGSRYYAASGAYIYVYDLRYGTWHMLGQESDIRSLANIDGRVVSFEHSDAYYVERDGRDEPCALNDGMQSRVELSPISEGSLFAVCPVGFTFCAFLGEGASLRLSISYEDGEWQEIYSTDREGRHNHRVRTSHVGRAEYYRLRFDCAGEWRLYSLARSYTECASGDWGE
ncbi:MAG: hypothetical protein IJE84_04535 [Clostridia bacterium]|nr:hypothetical protein [Clostridia bacterium]